MDAYVVQVGAALGDRTAGRRLARHHPAAFEHIDDRRQLVLRRKSDAADLRDDSCKRGSLSSARSCAAEERGSRGDRRFPLGLGVDQGGHVVGQCALGGAKVRCLSRLPLQLVDLGPDCAR